MAAGCAVVASRTAPVTEVITDRKSGLLVDFFSPAEVAARVDEVLEHPAEMAPIRKQARRTVAGRYDLRRICLPAHMELLGVTGKKAVAC